MININELRRLAQAATPGPWVSQGRYIGTPRHMSYIGEVRDQCGNWSDTEKSRADSAFIAAANPAVISELLDRLEAAERERDWHADRCEDAMNECAALCAKIAKMEQQVPVAEWIENRFHQYPQLVWNKKYRVNIGDKLYALPGAKTQGEEK